MESYVSDNHANYPGRANWRGSNYLGYTVMQDMQIKQGSHYLGSTVHFLLNRHPFEWLHQFYGHFVLSLQQYKFMFNSFLKGCQFYTKFWLKNKVPFQMEFYCIELFSAHNTSFFTLSFNFDNCYVRNLKQQTVAVALFTKRFLGAEADLESFR